MLVSVTLKHHHHHHYHYQRILQPYSNNQKPAAQKAYSLFGSIMSKQSNI